MWSGGSIMTIVGARPSASISLLNVSPCADENVSGVARRPEHVLEAGQHEAADVRRPVHRVVVAELAVHRVWVAPGVCAEGLERDAHLSIVPPAADR